MSDESLPLSLEIKQTVNQKSSTLITVSSYSFERNILTPGSAFRFTAEGVDVDVRLGIRSSAFVQVFANPTPDTKFPIAAGFIDETDTHITPSMVEYVITGRDTIGTLIDNSAIDEKNNIIFVTSISIINAFKNYLIKNTRLSKLNVIDAGVPSAPILFQTNPGETKINALQRYLEYANCLIWSNPLGMPILGKPNMAQAPAGNLICNEDGVGNNALEMRVRRNTNTAIQKIAVQVQDLAVTNPSAATKTNLLKEMQEIAPYGGGRSVYRTFTYGQGTDTVNLITQVGGSANPQSIGEQLALRELARENMKVLDVECVVKGHLNDNGIVFNIDQLYAVKCDGEDLDELMYVYSVRYDLTKDRGMLTYLRLCKLGTIVFGVPIRS